MAAFDADMIQIKIDKHWEDNQGDGRRNHLGGSLIGRECLRELWYSHRWATVNKFEGRILRLFQRGHKEEFSFVEYLTQIGVEVREYSQRLLWDKKEDAYHLYDWDQTCGGDEPMAYWDEVTSIPFHVDRAKRLGVKLKQWRISDVFGHFGGSLDGIAYGLPEIELSDGVFLCGDDPVLLEFKTHGLKSFNMLIKDGLKKAKPEHYSQMQVYMHKRGIRFGLYMAVNKNTDELKCFFVVADPVWGAGLIGKAGSVITAVSHPPRMSNNPSWYKCRFCDHRPTCHLGEPMEVNCRTCKFSAPVEDGQWSCAKWGSIIPLEAQKQGCESHAMITD